LRTALDRSAGVRDFLRRVRNMMVVDGMASQVLSSY
jgi:hypothetical protein